MRQKHLELVPPSILIKGPLCPILFNSIMAKDKLKIDLIYMAKGKLKIEPTYALINAVIISSIYKAVSEHERPTISGYCFSLRLKANIRQNKKGMLLCIPFNRSLFLNLCHIVSIDQQNRNKPYAGIFDIAYCCLKITVS